VEVYQQKGTTMKKILIALFTVLALSGTAQASTNHYSAPAESRSFLDDILGGESDWQVSPQPRAKAYRLAPTNYSGRTASLHRGHHSMPTLVRHYSTRGASSSIVAYGHMLQHLGYRVSEHPAFGGVHHVHHGWAHYAGRAIDINVGHGVREASSSAGRRFDALASQARRSGYTVLWRVAGHFDHMHIQR
jgi:hypothetical protein